MGEEWLHPVPSADNNSDIVRWTREMHPTHYALKIDSYSFLLQMLEKTGAKCYDSNIFQASGYKWKLSLYPNGDKENAGKGHISLYLIAQETGALPPGWEINAYFNMLVFDQIRDNYLTVQDCGGKVRRYHEMKKEWGFAQFLPHNVFNDATKGYIVQDKCVFGVEIFVNNYTGRGECLAAPEKPINSTYTWKFSDYSTSSSKMYSSPDFTLANCKWNIAFNPKGNWQEGKNISIYLTLLDLDTTPRIYVEYNVRIKDQKNHKHKEFSASHLFRASSSSWGWPSFLSVNDIVDDSKGYLVRDTLIVEVEITRISTLKSFR